MKKNPATQKWVANSHQIGRIKQVHQDGTVDIVLYNRQGKKCHLNRDGHIVWVLQNASPENWRRIEAPTFPLLDFYKLEELVTFK